MQNLRSYFQIRRKQYRNNIRQQESKAQRLKFQMALMKNHQIYRAYHEELFTDLKDRNYSSFYSNLSNMLSQPIYFEGVKESGLLVLYLKIIKANDNDDEEDQDKEQQSNKNQQFVIDDPKLAQDIVTRILYSLSKMIYNTDEGIKQLVSAIWKKLNSSMYIQAKFTLMMLCKIMKEQPTFHKCMLCLGLERQICDFIKEQVIDYQDICQMEEQQNDMFIKANGNQKQDLDKKDTSSMNQVLLDIVYNHLYLLQLEKKQKSPKSIQSQQQKQILQCVNSSDSDYFLNLAIINIMKNKHIKSSIQVLDILIDTSPYYVDFLNNLTLKKIFSFLEREELQLRKSVLQCIQTFTINCSNSNLDLLLSINILGFMDNQLTIEQNLKDKHQEPRICSITYILCNLFQTTNSHLKQMYQKHPILDHIFQYIQPGNRLIKTTRVFECYFRSFSKGEESQYRAIMDAFFEAIAVIDFSSKEAETLIETIRSMYVKSQEDKNIAEQQYIENKLMRLDMEQLIDNL